MKNIKEILMSVVNSVKTWLNQVYVSILVLMYWAIFNPDSFKQENN